MLGSTIKQLRKQSGLTQTKFAEELNTKYNLNVERSMVSKWETGSQTPMVYTISCMADFFGVSIDFLTGDEKKPPEGGKSELIELIIRELAALPTDKQQDVLRYIRFLRNG